jgi:TRAP-type mannitol/chloroaromatic compound transport system substrate-binding protein
MSMKKVLAIVLSLAMIISLAACGGGGGAMNNQTTTTTTTTDTTTTTTSSGEYPDVTWKMVTTWSAGTSHSITDQTFCDYVSKLSNGHFTINYYTVDEMCAQSEVFDYVSNGTVQCGGDWAGYWAGRDVVFELLATTMNLFTQMDYFLWCYEGGGLDIYQGVFGDYNMTYYPLVYHLAESGLRSTSKPISTVEDLKGMKVRLGGVLAGRVCEKLGITPVTVNGAELYESLQRGVIDAGEYSTPYSDYTLHLQEVTSYWVAPAWYQSAGCNGVMINLDAFNELPDNYKEIIEMASYLTMFDAMHRYDYSDIEATNEILAGGTQLNEWDPESWDIFAETAKEVYEEACQESEWFNTAYTSMLDYKEYISQYRDMLGQYGFGFN